MTSKINTEELKDKLGKTTEKTETKAKELFANHSHHYSNLDSWKRGLILIALVLFLIFVIYQLTTKGKTRPRELTEDERKQLEARTEARILKRAEFLRKLQQ
jgi:hypothetical protein